MEATITPARYTSFEKLVIIIAGMMCFMDMMGSSVLNTSFPQIAYALGVHPIELKIALTSYILALGVLMPVSGWFADKFGVRRLLLCAVTIFVLGAVLCGFSQNLTQLVIFRILQGLGGSFLIPVGRILILRVFSKERLLDAMMRVLAAGLIGGVIGPVVGGALTTYLSWRFIFFINPIIGLVIFCLVWRSLSGKENEVNHPVDRPFDYWGFVFFGAGLALLLYVFNVAAAPIVSTPIKILLFFVSLGLLWAYVIRARRIQFPMLNTDVFKEPVFRKMMAGSAMFRLSFSATLFAIPLMLQVTHKFSAMQSGLIILFFALGALTTRFLMTTLVRKLGYYFIIRWTSLIITLLCFSFALIAIDFSPWALRVVMYLYGFFISIQLPSVNTRAFFHVKKEHYGVAASMFSTLKQVVMCFSIALAALFLDFLVGRHGVYYTIAPRYFSWLYLGLGVLAFISWIMFYRASRFIE